MNRFLSSPWPWLALHLVLLSGVAALVVHYRDSVLADQDSQRRDWQEWREAAAKQKEAPGPVAREIPTSEEPPMVVLMRDNFPVIFASSILFPALILGFLMLVARGVFVQASATSAKVGPTDQ